MATHDIGEVLLELKKNLSGSDLQAVSDAFDKANIYILSDLGTDPKERNAVESKIDTTLSGAKLGAAALATVKAAFLKAWDASNAEPEPISRVSTKQKPVDEKPLPKPSGLIDLFDENFPSFRAEKDGHISNFVIPGDFKIKNDPNHPPRSFATIDNSEWILIFRGCGLTYALNFSKALSETEPDSWKPTWPIFYSTLTNLLPTRAQGRMPLQR